MSSLFEEFSYNLYILEPHLFYYIHKFYLITQAEVDLDLFCFYKEKYSIFILFETMKIKNKNKYYAMVITNHLYLRKMQPIKKKI